MAESQSGPKLEDSFFFRAKKNRVLKFWGLRQRDCLHRETMDFLCLSTALHSGQNILSEKEQWTFLQRQEVLLSPKYKLSRVVANYPV